MGKKAQNSLVRLLIRMFYLPFYYPTSWALWFIIEEVGGQKWYIPGAKTLMQKQFMKDGVAFLKEVRGIFAQYLGMPAPGPPGTKCKNCSNTAKFWCINCSKKFCPQCTIHMHAPGSVGEQHSIEELTELYKRDGVHIISPILPEIMGVILVTWICTCVNMISENYLTRFDMCPVVTTMSEASAYIDPHLFYWYKASFTSWCNYEDSFWKLPMDAWVRGIVTETDSTLLVFMNLPQALLFEVVVVIVMVPILSMMYALLLNIIFAAELYIPQTDFFLEVERIANFFDITNSKYFGTTRMDSSAPQTKPRRRKATDFMDAWTYWLARKMKYFRYFYNTTSASMKNFAWKVTMAVMGFRLACVWFGLGGYVRDLFAVFGWQTKIAMHQMWFQDAAGRMLVSESRLWETASVMPGVAKAFISVIPDPVWKSSWSLLKVLSVGWILVGLAIFSFAIIIVKQRREFKAEWLSGGREMALDFFQESCEEESKVKVPVTQKGRRLSINWGTKIMGS